MKERLFLLWPLSLINLQARNSKAARLLESVPWLAGCVVSSMHTALHLASLQGRPVQVWPPASFSGLAMYSSWQPVLLCCSASECKSSSVVQTWCCVLG